MRNRPFRTAEDWLEGMVRAANLPTELSCRAGACPIYAECVAAVGEGDACLNAVTAARCAGLVTETGGRWSRIPNKRTKREAPAPPTPATASPDLPQDGGMVDAKTAADMLSVSTAHIYREAKRGVIPFMKLGKCYRIPRAWLLAQHQKAMAAQLHPWPVARG